jgi:hypothetical protein
MMNPCSASTIRVSADWTSGVRLPKKELLVFAGVLSAAAIVLAVYGMLFPVKQVDVSVRPVPLVSANPPSGNSSASAAAPVGSAVLDIKELKARLDLPASLRDLKYRVAKLPGDSRIMIVSFGSERMDAQNCPVGTSPLGYLTYDSDQGGTRVATVKFQPLFYVDSQSGCASDELTADSAALQAALHHLVSDGR